MCLSTVYKNTENPENVLMSNVARIELRDNKVIITDLMEREQVIDGDLLFVYHMEKMQILEVHLQLLVYQQMEEVALLFQKLVEVE